MVAPFNVTTGQQVIKLKNLLPVIVGCTVMASCNYVTYTPRSKKAMLREQPSMLIFERIVDFRIEQMGWPTSKADMMSKGKKYQEVFNHFPYQETHFRIIDSNNMVFSFYQHRKDVENYKQSRKADLNSYGGTVKFFREDGKFLWKLKMK